MVFLHDFRSAAPGRRRREEPTPAFDYVWRIFFLLWFGPYFFCLGLAYTFFGLVWFVMHFLLFWFDVLFSLIGSITQFFFLAQFGVQLLLSRLGAQFFPFHVIWREVFFWARFGAQFFWGTV